MLTIELLEFIAKGENSGAELGKSKEDGNDTAR